jgi:hypothetical protein
MLVVLKELMVFVGVIFERVKSPNFFWGKIIESKKKTVGAKKDLKIFQTKSKIYLYLRVKHSIIPLKKLVKTHLKKTKIQNPKIL